MAEMNIIEQSTPIYGELLANGRIYRVPRFQRDYSWREEEWEDLWLDLLAIERGEEQYHFMGYIVLQSDDRRNFTIIDGQQRFTTLSILAMAVLKHLQELIDQGVEPEENSARLELLRNQFLGYKDPALLIPTSKLFLNRNNDDFYQSFLLRLRTPPDVYAPKPSEKLLWQAGEFFYRAIKQYLGAKPSGESLARLLSETVAQRLFFTMVRVGDELSAYKVFETLNARGVRLSSADLLKNYLFSVVDRTGPAYIDKMERQWQWINNTLGTEDPTAFLRHYWNSRHPLARKDRLFMAIKQSVRKDEDVFKLLGEMEKAVLVYLALSNPNAPRWNRDERRFIAALELFNAPQCLSLLLIGYDRLDRNEFSRLLKIIVAITFRYLVIGGLNPNTMENACNRAALKISSGEINTCRQIFQELKPVYVDDESFANDFSRKEIDATSSRNKRIVRYILFAIENQLSGKDYDFEDTTATIEHILPENLTPDWVKLFPAKEHQAAVHRLGNLTPLEAAKNRDIGDAPYDQKLPVYQTSAYLMTSKETNYVEWSPRTLHKRQERMSKWASALWRVDL
jgi:hypothetical protein